MTPGGLQDGDWYQAVMRSLTWRSPTLHFSQRGEGLEMELIDRAYMREPHTIPVVGFLRASRWMKTSIWRVTQPSSMETEVSAFKILLDQALCISSSNYLYLCSCSVTQSCLTLCDPVDCGRPGSSVHEIS